MQVFPDFQNELKALDSRLTIVQNPNHPQLANIKLNGKDICPIPSGDISDDPSTSGTITFPNGMTTKHRSRSEAIDLVNSRLELIKTKDGHDAFFGIGEYA